MTKQANLTTKESRSKLIVRDEPHWQILFKGCYLGFFRGRRADAWRGRFLMPDGTYERCKNPQLALAPDFTTAKRIVEDWAKTLGSSGATSLQRGTVREAIEAALEDYRRLNRHATADASEKAIRTILLGDKLDKPIRRRKGDPLADKLFESVTRNDVERFRERFSAGKTGKPLSPDSTNNYMKRLVATVRRAHRLDWITTLDAWDLEPIANGGKKQRTDFLTASQRDSIIAHAHPVFQPFLHALNLTGARPHEIANTVAADFDKKRGIIRLRDKKGQKGAIRERDYILGPKGRALFAQAAAGKIGNALLFTNDDGRIWQRDRWAARMREAVAAHYIDGGEPLTRKVRAYSFRHAHISEDIQIHRTEVTIVAQQHGTSVDEIEKSYLRIMPDVIRAQREHIG